MQKVLTRIVLLLCCYAWLPVVSGQPQLPTDLKKPKKYEERLLGSEKSANKKFTIPRRFVQNGVTKFNWHYNANVKLGEIIARAKAAYKDDYAQLLTFYNYSLDYTSASEKTELDSVIMKANAGILIHDLRNSWIDNMYMLLGKAYYFRKELDTAYLTFQYINYAFSPKEKDGYDIPIGSNANASDGGSAAIVSTKENRNLFQKVWSQAPSRNESFIWQIRTYIAKGALSEAAGLIETLKHDPQFPDRLQTDLKEVQAWWFYKQGVYDSAAVYLEMALPNAEGSQEKARWEYLIGQLYEKAGKSVSAETFYNRAAAHTFNPILEVYARLNAIRQNKGDDKIIRENIDALVKMARKDRYASYKQIIYYTAAQMELERNNIAGAKELLLRGTRISSVAGDDNSQRSQCFLLLAELYFREKDYPESKRFYDSVNITDIAAPDIPAIEKRKASLSVIVKQQQIMYRQDSLQRIAAMPEEERNDFLRKLARKLRKQQGLKEEEAFSPDGTPLLNKPDDKPADLFSNAKGEWYFDNSSLKAKGFTEFRNKWGTRPNVDNWRRTAAIQTSTANLPNNSKTQTGSANEPVAATTVASTYDALLKTIPLTPQLRIQSDDSIENAQLKLGKELVDGLEDYETAITTLEGFLSRFSNSSHQPEALFYLYYCYLKTGRKQRSDEAAVALKNRFPSSEFSKKLADPNGVNADRNDMTRRYDNIYNLFIEGNFTEALAQKRVADSLYGTNYWTPQLLYIQSIYHVRQQEDPVAKRVLQDIIRLYPTSPLSNKAKVMLDVLNRRKEIEDYLTKLQIERPKEDTLVAIDDSPTKPTVAQQPPPVVQKDTVQAVVKETAPKPSAVKQPAVKKDSTQTAPAVAARKDSVQAVAPPVAKKDSVHIAPPIAKKDSVQPAPPVVAKDTAQAKAPVVAAAPPKDTAQNKLPAVTVTAPKDTAQARTSVTRRDSSNVTTAPVVAKQDSIKAKPLPAGPVINSVFTYNAAAPQYVTIVMDKVDPVYVTEARNAFNRYNRENYAGKAIEISNISLNDELKLVVMNNFANASEAITYIEKAQKTAATEIIPWLPAAKYTFITISAQNLDLLKSNKDIKAYKDFLRQAYPGKF
ncbi:MAG: hypothetical protein QM731_25650 [Chitinophagaceae bacterium]